MRSYNGICQSDEIGYLDCACGRCRHRRYIQACVFIADDKARRTGAFVEMRAPAPFIELGDIIVESCEVTVVKTQRIERMESGIVTRPGVVVSIWQRVSRLLRRAS